MGHQTIERKSPLPTVTAVLRTTRSCWLENFVLAVTTTKSLCLPHLFRIICMRSVQRKGLGIVVVPGRQGSGLFCRNQCDLHCIVPVAMPSLGAGRSENVDILSVA